MAWRCVLVINDEWCSEREKLDAFSYHKNRSWNFKTIPTQLLGPVLSDASGAIYMKQIFLTLKKVIMSSMGSFCGQTKWRAAWGEEMWVNSFSNGVLICGGNLQRAAPGCFSWDDETEVTAWQLLLVVSLIRQPQQQSWRRMIDLGAPAQLIHEGCQDWVRVGFYMSMWKKEKVWVVGGVVLYFHLNQVGSWP